MYWLTGYGLSWGKGNAFIALNWWKDIGDGSVLSSNLLYEYLLSALPVTILSGTITKHCNPIAFVANSVILSGKDIFSLLKAQNGTIYFKRAGESTSKPGP